MCKAQETHFNICPPDYSVRTCTVYRIPSGIHDGYNFCYVHPFDFEIYIKHDVSAWSPDDQMSRDKGCGLIILYSTSRTWCDRLFYYLTLKLSSRIQGYAYDMI